MFSNTILFSTDTDRYLYLNIESYRQIDRVISLLYSSKINNRLLLTHIIYYCINNINLYNNIMMYSRNIICTTRTVPVNLKFKGYEYIYIHYILYFYCNNIKNNVQY